jgi:hypothetical protein
MDRRRSLALSIATVFALVAGCADKEFTPVRGQVFYNDKPLTNGVVMFQPPFGPPARGTIQPDGTFELTTLGKGNGARPGINQVRVSSREEPPTQNDELKLGRLLIPERYTQFGDSGLTADVKAEDNEPFVFHLTD